MILKRATSLAVVLATAATLSTAIDSRPAEAAPPNRGIVYVDSRVSGAWPVSTAKTFVDRYTGSRMVWGACRAGYKCIRIRERKIKSSWAAVTKYYTREGTSCRACTVDIFLNPSRRHRPWAERRNIVSHELGHANGLMYESRVCTNVMYYRVRCWNGSLPRYRFTAPAVNILRRN